MPRFDLSGLAPEPLALRIRPLPDECFDSWIGRVATSHEMTRAELFRHLDIEPRLAHFDLARGRFGLNISDSWAFEHMLNQLAWAVQTDPSKIENTFIARDADLLLPRLLRRYICARCWLEALAAERPFTIARAWILRISWRCRVHALSLSLLGVFEDGVMPHVSRKWLESSIARAERLKAAVPARPAMIARNEEIIHTLERGWRVMKRSQHKNYHARFARNSYHFSTQRIAMLALAHSDRQKSVRRFEKLVSLHGAQMAQLLPISLDPAKIPLRHRLPRAAANRHLPAESDLFALLSAYAHVRKEQASRGT